MPIENLIVIAEFRDYIYPGLVSTGKIERGGDKPFHTVINGENFHALEALTFTHRGKIDAIYIDPPYNSGARDWKYNNDYVEAEDLYRHSKWLAMMERRLLVAKQLLNAEASVLVVTIDEKEIHRLAGVAQGGGNVQRAEFGTARFECRQHLKHGLALQLGSDQGQRHETATIGNRAGHVKGGHSDGLQLSSGMSSGDDGRRGTSLKAAPELICDAYATRETRRSNLRSWRAISRSLTKGWSDASHRYLRFSQPSMIISFQPPPKRTATTL